MAVVDAPSKPREERKENIKKSRYAGTSPSLPIICGKKAFKELVKQWIDIKVLTIRPPRITLIEKMKLRPDYCMFHQYLGHSTKDCYTLRRKYHEKLESGEIEARKKDEYKASYSMITNFEKVKAKFQRIPLSLEEVPNPNMQAKAIWKEEEVRISTTKNPSQGRKPI